jgi:hypothetical protein
MAAPTTVDASAVRRLQERLVALGLGSMAADGIYGPQTHEAVTRVLGRRVVDELTPELLELVEERLGAEPAQVEEPVADDLSLSLRDVRQAFAGSPTGAFALAAGIIGGHGNYGGGAAESVQLEVPPSETPQRSIDEWYAAIRSLYVPLPERQLNGRKALIGLALLDPALRSALSESGLLAAVEAEVTDLASILSGRGRALHTPDAVPTLTDQPSDVDLLGRKAFAETLAARLGDEYDRSVVAKGVADSFVLHLEGPWGSGKTSLLRFLAAELEEKGWLVVTFNAWQHQRVGAPWWLLLAEVQREAVRKAPRLKALELQRRALFWRIWIARWRLTALLGALVLLALATGIAIAAGARRDAALVGVIAGTVTTLAAAIGALRGMGGAFASKSGAEDFVRQAADPMNTLRRRFCELIDAIDRPVAIFVDDLDRCRAPYTVELLEGIQTVLRDPPVAFVVAADRHWLYDCYRQAYPEHDRNGRDPGRPLGHLFLEKTFQLSTSVPRLSSSEQEEFWRSLIFGGAKGVDEGQAELEQRIQAEFEHAGSEEEIFAALDRLGEGSPAERRAARTVAVRRLSAPELERATEHTLARFARLLEPNPRAMKRLVNAYGVERALQILGGHAMDLERPRERLALWTILKSRWPLLADYLEEEPDAVEQLALGEVPEAVAADAARPYLASLFRDEEVQRVVSGSVVGVGLDAASLRLLLDGPTAADVVHA